MNIASKEIFEEVDALPYDSEVEYIDVIKTQFDTEFTPQENFKLKFKFKTIASSDWTPIVRCNSFDIALSHSGGSSTCHVQQFGSASTFVYFNTLNDTTIEWTKQKILANSTTTTLQCGTWKQTKQILFGPSNSQNVERLYWLQAYNGSDLMRDFIPVRKGNVGYFYDQFSKILIGNKTQTGQFAIGPDKK